MSRRLLALLLSACGAASACAPALLTLPSGPGGPAPDLAGAVAQATSVCRGVTSMSAVVAVSGSIGGQRLRGRLLVGIESPASARIEAAAPFGQPVFILVARDAEATLLLPREERVVEHASPDAVLEAVTGVPVDASSLRAVLTGCATAPDAARGRALGDDWRVVPDGAAEIYLRRDAPSASWRVQAAVFGASPRSAGPWRAEYRDFQDGLPRAIRLVSTDRGRFDLRLALSQVDLNPALGSEVFRVDVPRTAQPMTVEELRRARPGLRQD